MHNFFYTKVIQVWNDYVWKNGYKENMCIYE